VTVRICDDREGDLCVANFVDVFDPLVVRCEVVGTLHDMLATPERPCAHDEIPGLSSARHEHQIQASAWRMHQAP
jgi:hypothetical protein